MPQNRDEVKSGKPINPSAKPNKGTNTRGDNPRDPQPAQTPTGPSFKDSRPTDPNGAGQPPKTQPPEDFPVICIGASAGGLGAIEAFAGALPANSGLTFVVVTHTDPEHASMLPELIKKKANAKVALIEDGMTVEVNTIYVPPSNRDPVIAKGVFKLTKRPGKSKIHMPIDLFCKHLASEKGERAGCVILSGTGTDGTQGLRLIKEKAGVGMAQDKISAQHTGMPESAVETGLVDFVLEPEKMPSHLIDYFHHPAAIKVSPDPDGNKAVDPLQRILSFLANRTRHDFSLYKTSTLIRRIERRMTVTRSKNAAAYLDFLYHNPPETRALFQDLLIGVTNFFRDPEAFAALKQQALPTMMDRSRDGGPFRVWMPACATGEEAFSVAILIKEYLEENGINREMQIFATDIDAVAIDKARRGAYLLNIAADVTDARLKRFFSKIGDEYIVKREIREPVIFAEQNVLRDPPFTSLDLLVCRNLLIYLKPEAQNKLLPLFHYALKRGGILFLGSSETVGRFPDLFEPMSKSHSIYSRKDSIIRPPVEFPTGPREFEGDSFVKGEGGAMVDGPTDQQRLVQMVEKELLKAHTPSCIIVNRNGELLHIHGRTGKYLELPAGRVSSQVSDLAREGLRFPLLSALRRAQEKNAPVYEQCVRVKTNGGFQRIDLTVKPLDKEPLKHCLMVIFEDIPDSPQADGEAGCAREAASDNQKVADLEQELMRVNQDYRSALEELETSNEELKSTNEEMHSSNEELQSTNEELESSREELQSLNEELSTVNSELHGKIEELNNAYSAITHVLNSTRIAILFLDTELKVQRFTAEASQLINLIDSDIGRPIEHIAHNLEFDGLAEKAREVLENLTGFEVEVCTKDGRWYRMSIRVHRTEEHAIEGVVLTFIDIDMQKSAQQELASTSQGRFASACQLAGSVIDAMPESLLVLDEKMQVVAANHSYYRMFKTSPKQTEGKGLFALGKGHWEIDALKKGLHGVLEADRPFDDLLVEATFVPIGARRLRLDGCKLYDATNQETRILLTIIPAAEG